MKLKIKIVCMLFLSVPINLYADQFATETVLIIIDDTEPSEYGGQLTRGGQLKKHEGLGAAGTDLLTALYEEECIIIVASSVVHYVMRYLEEVSKNPFDLHPRPSVKPYNWIKKKVSDYLYILIPKKYISSRPNQNNVRGSSKYTQEELTTGLIFANKKNMSDDDFMSPYFHKKNTQYPRKTETQVIGAAESTVTISWISDHFVKNLSNLFIPKQEFSASSPGMALLLEGHGSKYTSIDDQIALVDSWKNIRGIEKDMRRELQRLQNLKAQGKKSYAAGIIAGLNAPDFAQFIQFLASSVPVTFLFINTCFGSEINLQEALKDITGEQASLEASASITFPMVSGALASSYAVGGYRASSSVTRSGKEIVYLTMPRYKKFFDTLNTEASSMDERFFDALDYIYPYYQKYESYNNIPVVKYPGQPWRVLELFKVIVTLDDSKIQNKNVVDVSPYFTVKKLPKINPSRRPPPIEDFLNYKMPYPNILLLTKADMPFELVLSGSAAIDLPALISQIPGDAVHHIAKLDASSYELSRVLETFFNIHDLQDNKMLIIDELIAKNDLTVLPLDLGKAASFYHVVLHNKPTPNSDRPPKKFAFFEVAGKEWVAENISMGNPLGFAVKAESKPGRAKALLATLPGGLQKYYPSIKTEDGKKKVQ